MLITLFISWRLIHTDPNNMVKEKECGLVYESRKPIIIYKYIKRVLVWILFVLISYYV